MLFFFSDKVRNKEYLPQECQWLGSISLSLENVNVQETVLHIIYIKVADLNISCCFAVECMEVHCKLV